MCCCCNIWAWLTVLASIGGALLVFLATTPACHDVVTLATGWEPPWNRDQHHVFADNVSTTDFDLFNSAYSCVLEEGGLRRIITHIAIGALAGGALFLICLAIYRCTTACPCRCRRRPKAHSKEGNVVLLNKNKDVD
jgi:hypothetical protein